VSHNIHAFIATLPKAELHVHLVGSASVDTVLELARRHPSAGVPTERSELERFYAFADFAHFIDVYIKVNSLIRSGADVVTLLIGLASDLARSSVRYAEVTVTALSHLQVGIDAEELTEALGIGRARAAIEHGVELAWIFDIPGPMDPRQGMDTLDYVLGQRPEGTVGFGLGGPELGVSREQFKSAFELAVEAGLHSVPHAGETTGPETVWSALRTLKAERIGHGISSVEDPTLLDHLAAERIPLEISLSSNLCTKAVASLDKHPLPRFLKTGVPVTVNTDDPGMFGTNLNREYLLCHQTFGLDACELAELARNAARAAFCSERTRAALLAEIDAVSAAGG
jgi:aminodeoxyfutalosine deaminase